MTTVEAWDQELEKTWYFKGILIFLFYFILFILLFYFMFYGCDKSLSYETKGVGWGQVIRGLENKAKTCSCSESNEKLSKDFN